MKQITTLYMVLVCACSFAQVDLFDSKIWNFNVGLRSNSFKNFYAEIPHSEVYNSNPGPSKDLSTYLVNDKGTGFSYALDFCIFDEKGFITTNYDGLLNMFYTYFADGKAYKGPHATIVGTPAKNLKDFNQLQKYQKTFVNYDILHINALFGNNVLFGFGVNWKTYNFIGPFTYFDDGAGQGKTVYTTFRNGLDAKLTLAPIIGYRHSFDKSISFYAVTGVHFGANKRSQSEFNFRNNPFLDFKCYLGEKSGACFSLQYNHLSLKSSQNPFVGSANIPFSPQNLSINTLNLQVGVFMNFKD